MGAAVFAGGAQIVVAQRLMAGAGAGVAAIAGLALNLRLFLITASIRGLYARRPWWQVALGAHLATDENWALMLSERAKGRTVGFWYLVGGGLSLVAVWCCATVAGATFSQAIPNPRAIGMDFAFTAAFIAIARSLWRGRRDALPWLTAAGVVALAIRGAGLEPSWALVLGGVTGAAVAGVARRD
jgi:predicted branched-subunit amino acid permease